jgi:MFS family permease
MGVIQLGQNAGMLVGPLVFGALAESTGGWPVPFASLAVMCALGGFAGWLAREKAGRGAARWRSGGLEERASL